MSQSRLAPELEPDPTGWTCFVPPLVGGPVHEVQSEPADPVGIFDARLDEPNLGRRRGLFHLDPDVVLVGLDDHAHDIAIAQAGVANGVGGDLAERQPCVVVSLPQLRRRDSPGEGGSSEKRGLLVGG
jgi:hypothetical protein